MGRSRLDLTGRTFDRLTVREFSHSTPYTSSTGQRTTLVFWRCDCACGGSKPIRGDSLKRGNTRSCGCLRRERGREQGVSGGETGRHPHLAASGVACAVTGRASLDARSLDDPKPAGDVRVV